MATPNDASATAQVRTGIEELRAARLHMRIPYFLALLADAHRRAGDEAGALAAVEEAFAHVSVTGERRWEPELHRLRGEMLLSGAAARPAPAEAALMRGIEIAREQGSKSLELRGAVSLAQVWREQGRDGEALELLTTVYDCFTEGLEAADLRAARTLLTGLGRVDQRVTA